MRKYLMLCIAAVFMFGMVMPAAADTSFYGQVWFDMYQDSDTNAGVAPVPSGDNDLIWEMNDGNARIGAKFTGDVIDANVEAQRTDGTWIRHFYADWKLGGGKTLRIGQYWDAALLLVGNWVFLPGIGEMGGRTRCEQIRLIMPAGPATLTISLEQPVSTTLTGFTETDTSIPMIFVKADVPAGPATITPFVGYNSVSCVTGEGTTNEASADIDTTMYGVKATATFGQASVGLLGWTGTNLTYGFYSTAFAPIYVAGTKTLYDSDTTGYHASVSFKVNDMVKIRGGYGSTMLEMDTGVSASKKQTKTGYYANAVFTLAKGVELYVAYDYYDYGDLEQTAAGVTTTTPQGDKSCIGARFILYF